MSTTQEFDPGYVKDPFDSSDLHSLSKMPVLTADHRPGRRRASAWRCLGRRSAIICAGGTAREATVR